MGLNFVVIDFETANVNYNSACSIGIIHIYNNQIIDKFYSLIQPPTLDFDEKNISIHGITPDDVVNAPKFNELWPTISKYFTSNYIITAYNAVFDMTVLKACLNEYSIDNIDFEYFCSLQLAKHLYDCDSYKLASVTEFLNIELTEAHNALADAMATAELLKLSIGKLQKQSWQAFFMFFNRLNWNNFKDVKEVKSFKKKASKFAHSPSVQSITCNNDSIDCNHIFYNKNFVFTGELETISRKDAMQKVVDVGGILKSGVSRSTNYVVVGEQDKSIVGDDGLSSKERKALELIESGYDIKILSEKEFLKQLA